MTIHERIKSRRKECQMSVEDVANELGVSRSTIYRYESSEISNIGIDKIEPLARVLHTTPEYLMGWTEDPIDYSDGDLIAEIPGCYVEACEGDIKHAYAMMQAVDKDNRGTHVKESCANRIRAGLSMRGMTQSDLCRITGIPKSAMSQYCNGGLVHRQDRTFLIASALNVSEAWLMGLDVPMERKTTPVSLEEDGHNVNVVKIAGRDGRFIEKELNDKQLQALIAFVDLLPDASDDL